MKALSTIAVIGLLSLTLNAQAQTAAVSQKAVSAMQQSATAKQFLQNKLGVRPGASAADVNAALSRLGATERAAAFAAINKFSSKAVINGDSSAISANEALAKTVFSTSNGQLIDLSKSVTNTASRDAVVNQCSNVLSAAALAAGTNVSVADVQKAIDAGVLKRGKCETNPEEMSVDARGTLVRYASLVVSGMPKVDAMIQAFKEKGVTISAKESEAKISKISTDCGYFAGL